MHITKDDSSKLVLTQEDLHNLRMFFDRHVFIPQFTSGNTDEGTDAFWKLTRAITLTTEGKSDE